MNIGEMSSLDVMTLDFMSNLITRAVENWPDLRLIKIRKYYHNHYGYAGNAGVIEETINNAQ